MFDLAPKFCGLFDSISGTWILQMSYSVGNFWAYQESMYFETQEGCSSVEIDIGGDWVRPWCSCR